jgi:hypothetical protein
MDFSKSERITDGLYVVTVRDITNKIDVVMPSKYIRFQTPPGATVGPKPDRSIINQTYREKKDADAFLKLFAASLRSENDFMTSVFGAVYEKKNAKDVVAVYVPVENIKSDSDAQFVLANLHAMKMSERDLLKKAKKAYKGEPFNQRSDADELKVIIDTAYDPSFLVEIDTPDKDPVTNATGPMEDSRAIVLKNMYFGGGDGSARKTKKPAFLNKGFKGNRGGNNNNGRNQSSTKIVGGVILVVLLVLIFMASSLKNKNKK